MNSEHSQPQTPSTSFLDATSALIKSRVAAEADAQGGSDLQLDAYPQQSAVWAAVDGEVAKLQSDLDFIVEDLHAHPELAF